MKNSSFHFDRFDFRRNLSRKLPLSFVKPIAEQPGDVIVESELESISQK